MPRRLATMITGTLCLLALIVALAPPGNNVADFATDSSQLLETLEDSELSSSGRHLTTHYNWPSMSRPNDGIYYRLDWISRAYTDDVSFVDGCSSPTSLQYMRELNPICNAHDLCYRCRINWGLSTAWCDAMLLRRCKDVCHANWPNWWDWWHRGFCQGTCDTMNVGLTWYSVRANNERSARRSNDCWPSWRPFLERPFSVGKPSNRCNNMASC